MKRYLRRFFIWKGIVLSLVIFALLVFFALKFLLPVVSFAKQNSLTPDFIANFILGSETPLKKNEDRTHILILGMAGANHAGADLTDTMIFLSLNHQNKKTVVFSLPRDIWSDTLKDKINSAYHYGEIGKINGGLELSDAIVEEILNQPVHYVFLIDFSFVKEIINIISGIEVYVDNSFDDYKYPLDGLENDLCDGDIELKCRYEAIHFNKGWQKMDGETALKFIRSRNAEGDEGSDFARSKRQQKILEALKNRLMSKETLTKPKQLILIWEAFKKNSKTNANLADILYLGKEIISEKERATIPVEEQFVNAPIQMYEGKWVLVPRENWDDFHRFIEGSLK